MIKKIGTSFSVLIACASFSTLFNVETNASEDKKVLIKIKEQTERLDAGDKSVKKVKDFHFNKRLNFPYNDKTTVKDLKDHLYSTQCKSYQRAEIYYKKKNSDHIFNANDDDKIEDVLTSDKKIFLTAEIVNNDKARIHIEVAPKQKNVAFINKMEVTLSEIKKKSLQGIKIFLINKLLKEDTKALLPELTDTVVDILDTKGNLLDVDQRGPILFAIKKFHSAHSPEKNKDHFKIRFSPGAGKNVKKRPPISKLLNRLILDIKDKFEVIYSENKKDIDKDLNTLKTMFSQSPTIKDFTSFHSFIKKLDFSKVITFPNINDFFFQKSWSNYYKTLSFNQKCQIVKEFILEGGLTLGDKIEIEALWIASFIKYSGPVFQKITQKAASVHMVSMGMNQKILEAWQSGLSREISLSRQEITDLQRLFKDTPSDKITIEPIGEGSIARTVKVKLDNKDTLCIKYLKKTFDLNTFENDANELKKITDKDYEKKAIEDIIKKTKQEQDLIRESKFIIWGKDSSSEPEPPSGPLYDAPQVPMLAVHKIHEELSKDDKRKHLLKQYLLMEYIEGETLDKVLAKIKKGTIPIHKVKELRQGLQNLYMVFIQQMIRKKHVNYYYYHLDLHPSNILVSYKGSSPVQVIPVDYGRMGCLASPYDELTEIEREGAGSSEYLILGQVAKDIFKKLKQKFDQWPKHTRENDRKKLAEEIKNTIQKETLLEDLGKPQKELDKWVQSTPIDVYEAQKKFLEALKKDRVIHKRYTLPQEALLLLQSSIELFNEAVKARGKNDLIIRTETIHLAQKDKDPQYFTEKFKFEKEDIPDEFDKEEQPDLDKDKEKTAVDNGNFDKDDKGRGLSLALLVKIAVPTGVVILVIISLLKKKAREKSKRW
ncbi:MAG: AarF/UbiB family protein [Bacteroidota bacterium]